MPPAKSRPVNEDARAEASNARERQVAAAAHARSKRNGAAAHQNGSSLKELALVSTESGNVVAPGQITGVVEALIGDAVAAISWDTVPTALLNTYRVAHNLSTPAAFTSPYRQALLSNPGIGRQSPTMARRKEKRRVAKEQLALAVRKNFNSAAVSETDVVVEFVYRVRHQDKAFRMRSLPSAVKKP